MAKPLAFEEAVREVMAHVAPLPAVRMPAAECAGHAVAADLASELDLPPFDNSAMDGYVLRAADTEQATGAAPARLRLVGESRAGEPADEPLQAGCAMRISTGAAVPVDADAVLRVEDSAVEDGHLLVRRPLAPGNDVRPAGDDVRRGDVVLLAGTRVGAGELAMLASIGATEADVVPHPKVAIVATGDELVPPGEPLGHGQIHDSNSVMLERLAHAAGGDVVLTRVRVADERAAVDAAIGEALDAADVVILSGGVSKGEHDHVKPALDAAGVRQVFWQIALRPGHPLWFGAREAAAERPTLVFGLPGNPVSAYVTFHLFAAPALAGLAGMSERPLTIDARYSGPRQPKRAGFAQILRCGLSNEDGAVVARPTSSNQRSHAVTSTVGVDGLAILPPESEGIDDGDTVVVRLVPR
jgi:molybdopterin molybdotransferase